MSMDPVIIIGAGPSGLLLARFLQLHRIPVVIYVRDSSPTHRLQGGPLDLHDNTGLKTLRETGLLDEARIYMRAEGEAMKIWIKVGRYGTMRTMKPRYPWNSRTGDQLLRGRKLIGMVFSYESSKSFWRN